MSFPPSLHRRRRWRIPAILAATLLVSGAAAVLTLSSASAAAIDTNAYYQLVSRHSGKAIDIESASTADGAAVVQWARRDGTSQQFRFLASGGGFYRIQARHSGKAIDVAGASAADGANVVQWADHGGTNQQFQVVDMDSGYVKLINRNSGKALDVWARSTADGARISQYSDTGAANQQWQLVRVGGGPTTPPGPGRQLFVASSGNDANAGTSASAPLRTISRCAELAVAGDTCQIGGGTYRETVRPPRSGTAGAPITFAAAPGATVRIDGTDPVAGWTRDSGNIYRAPVTLAGTAANPYSSTEDPANADLWANQVFVGSRMVPEAAYPTPSSDPWDQSAFVQGGWSSTRDSGGDCDIPPCTKVINGTLTYNSFPALGDMTGAVAYFTGGWVALSATVTGGNLTSSNHTINMSWPQSGEKVYPGGGNSKNFRLVGKKAFLRGANQWFYDAGARQLYLWAPDGGVPTSVYAKKRNYAFDLRGRSHINVTGIGVHATTITANDSSSNIVLDGITGEWLSHWQTAQYNLNLPRAGIYDANHRYDSGIVLHGTNNTIRNSTLRLSAGNGVNLKGSGHVVDNNLIHDVSYGGTYTAAVTLEVGTANSAVTNNTMHDMGRDAINMNTNLYPNPGYRNNRIAYNNIYAYAKVAFDLGGIYVCCDTSMAGTRIDHNRIHDPVHTGNGMHFDNGTHDVTVDHNVIWGLKSVGDFNHGGNGINFGGHTNRPPAGSNLPYLRGTFANNTIVAARGYTIFNYYASASHVANTTVDDNILDGARPSDQIYAYITGGNPNDSGNFVTGFSNGSGTDPQYTNRAAGDHTLRTGSPAYGVGAYENGTRWQAGCSWSGCDRR